MVNHGTLRYVPKMLKRRISKTDYIIYDEV